MNVYVCLSSLCYAVAQCVYRPADSRMDDWGRAFESWLRQNSFMKINMNVTVAVLTWWT